MNADTHVCDFDANRLIKRSLKAAVYPSVWIEAECPECGATRAEKYRFEFAYGDDCKLKKGRVR